jgi:hypothetical protein
MKFLKYRTRIAFCTGQVEERGETELGLSVAAPTLPKGEKDLGYLAFHNRKIVHRTHSPR